MPGLQPASYNQLLRTIRDKLVEGRMRAERAVERERLATYHEVGRLIEGHLARERGNPEYGEKLFQRLAEDLEIAERLLRDGLGLYRWHPILHARAELGWTHYRILLRIPSETDRNLLENEAAENHWPTRELEQQVRERLPSRSDGPEKPSAEPALPPLDPLRGLIDTVKVVDLASPGGRVLDLGFTVYHPPDELGIERVSKGCARLEQRGRRSYDAHSTRSQRAVHYSYLARVERVIDGDTLLLQIRTAIRTIVRQRVRLRGIDTPEMGSPGGERSKTFVEKILDGHDWIGITSTKPDAYDRYLVDVFVPNEDDRDQGILDRGRFLNQMLVDEGLAMRVEY